MLAVSAPRQRVRKLAAKRDRQRVGQLVNAVAHSRYWDSTAIFVTYDESGGFWDHLAPLVSTGYGARTPLIIISPYAGSPWTWG